MHKKEKYYQKSLLKNTKHGSLIENKILKIMNSADKYICAVLL